MWIQRTTWIERIPCLCCVYAKASQRCVYTMFSFVRMSAVFNKISIMPNMPKKYKLSANFYFVAINWFKFRYLIGPKKLAKKKATKKALKQNAESAQFEKKNKARKLFLAFWYLSEFSLVVLLFFHSKRNSAFYFIECWRNHSIFGHNIEYLNEISL